MRGGWTCYTGSAGWMYRAGVEAILGLTRQGQMLILNPSFPRHWPQVELAVTFGDRCFSILVRNPLNSGHGIASALVDGVSVAVARGRLLLPLTGGAKQVQVTLGPTT